MGIGYSLIEWHDQHKEDQNERKNSLNGCWITNRSSLISISLYIHIYISQSIEIWVWINLLKSELEELWGILPVEKKTWKKRISSSPGGNIKNPAEPGAMWAGGDRKENRLFPASDGLCPWRADLTVDMWWPSDLRLGWLGQETRPQGAVQHQVPCRFSNSGVAKRHNLKDCRIKNPCWLSESPFEVHMISYHSAKTSWVSPSIGKIFFPPWDQGFHTCPRGIVCHAKLFGTFTWMTGQTCEGHWRTQKKWFKGTS